MGFILWAAPIIAVLLLIIINKTKVLHMVSICTSFILVLAAGFTTRNVIVYGKLDYIDFIDIFYIDALSIIILDIVILIGFLVSIYSIGYLKEEQNQGVISNKRIKLYYTLMYSFIFTMILALTVNNIGILWIAIEATTLSSTFLVGFHNDKRSLEAAWKYVIICSVGIAIALVGIIFMHLSSVEVISKEHALQWDILFDNAKALNTPVLRLSFIFIVIGFGTKAGLAPMHTWLPDAHSQAPSPISALLSGVLLNSSMYAIIRTIAIVNKNLGNSDFTGKIMIGFGFLSIATAAIFILTQKDYKRLLAYSSIEHMGIVALSIGLFTPLSVFAALFHMMNHSFTKAMLFLASGNMLQKYGTREIFKIHSLLKTLPFSGPAFFIGLFAISGTPPFSIFSSEINVFIAIFSENHIIIGVAFILLLSIVFVGISITLFRVFYGANNIEDILPGETNIPGTAVILILLVLIILSGLYMPEVLINLITNAQNIIIGG